MYLSPLRLWGKGGHLNLLLFPVTQMCAGVCPHLYQTLFTQYFLQVFTNGFQIHRYGDHGQDLELTFRDYGSIFKVTWGHYVSKLTLFTQYFLQFFTNGFQILRYGDYGQNLELVNFLWLLLNFKGHQGSFILPHQGRNSSQPLTVIPYATCIDGWDKWGWGSLCFLINFVYAIFPTVFHQWLSTSQKC